VVNTTSNFTYDNTLNGYVERITTALGDDEPGHENTTYSKEYLAALICDVFVMLSQIHTSLFPVQEVEFTVKTGTCTQRLPDECEEFIEFMHVLDANGRCVPIYEGDFNTIERYASFPQPCRNCKGDVMASVPGYTAGISAKSDRLFNLSPMAPASIALKVVALCKNFDSIVGSGDKPLPQKLRGFAVMIEYLVLSLAVSKDDPALSTQHYNAFLQLANLSLQNQARLQELMDERNN
jgi:hypothetical protein